MTMESRRKRESKGERKNERVGESGKISKIYRIKQDYRNIYFFISGTIFLSFVHDVT